MKRMTTMLAIGTTALFFTACGGGGSSSSNGGNTPAPATTVNLVGTWNDTFSTSNSICDGLIASYVAVNEPYNGDPNILGASSINGTTFAIDSAGNCYLTPINRVITTYVGTPSNMTKKEYIEFQKQALAGIGTIDSFDIINFNTHIISAQINYTNGVTMYIDAARQ